MNDEVRRMKKSNVYIDENLKKAMEEKNTTPSTTQPDLIMKYEAINSFFEKDMASQGFVIQKAKNNRQNREENQKKIIPLYGTQTEVKNLFVLEPLCAFRKY
jgi:hypothetical protein